MWGAGPPATWAFAIFLASDMLFLRLFPGGFGVFAFSQCDEKVAGGDKTNDGWNSSMAAAYPPDFNGYLALT